LRFLAIALVLALGIWTFRTLFPGDEKLIRKLLAEVAQSAEVKPNENPLFKLAGGNKLVGFFSADAVLKVDVTGADFRTIRGRDDLLQAVTAARAGLQEAKFRLHEVHVAVGSDKQSATAQLVASAYINGSSDPIAQELKMRLGKIDRRWRILQVETVRDLGM
jgi:ketosteroid isomerase-like protein